MKRKASNGILQREMPEVSIRSINKEKRTVELSFSSETPYRRWGTPEILDHGSGACDLARLKEIGCVLFNHNRDQVIAKINQAEIRDGRGVAEIEFDSDEFSNTIFEKVVNGTLKGVSVGYIVTDYEWVESGETSKDKRFTGPCEIARKWEPLEISIVSVPADATVGVGRSAEPMEGSSLESRQRQLQLNINISRR